MYVFNIPEHLFPIGENFSNSLGNPAENLRDSVSRGQVRRKRQRITGTGAGTGTAYPRIRTVGTGTAGVRRRITGTGMADAAANLAASWGQVQ